VIAGTKGKTVKSLLTDNGFTKGGFEKSLLGDHIGQMMAITMTKVPGCAFMVKKLSVKQTKDDLKVEFN